MSVIAMTGFSAIGIGLALGSAVSGLFFRQAATAWRLERDAEKEKAERLEEKVAAQAAQIEAQAAQIDKLEHQVKRLDAQTNVEQLAERITQEHREIVEALRSVEKGLYANTTALEFMFKQLFPATVLTPAEAA